MAERSAAAEQYLKQLERMKKVAFVDASDDIESRAREMADASMTEDKKDIKWYSFKKKIWDHNFAKEYKRQRAIINAREKIKNTGSQFADFTANTGQAGQYEEGRGMHIGRRDLARLNEADRQNADLQKHHEQAMQAIIERFTSEYDQAVHTGQLGGEEKQVVNNYEINQAAQELIKDYAAGRILDKTAFEQERVNRFSQIRDVPPELIKQGVAHVDNLFQVAEIAKKAVDHGISVDNLDLRFDIIVGKARDAVRVEANLNGLDKAIDKIKSTKVGALLDENTVALGTAALYSATVGAAQKVGRSKLVAWATLGAGAVAAGGISAAKENARLKHERAQMQREASVNKTNVRGEDDPEPTSWVGKKLANLKKRKGVNWLAQADRQEIGEHLQKTRSANEISDNIESNSLRRDRDGRLELNKEMTQAQFEAAIKEISGATARIEIGIENKTTLLDYSHLAKKTIENTRLELTKATAEANLREWSNSPDFTLTIPDGLNFDRYLEREIIARKNEFAGEVTEKNKAFNKMKARKVAGRFVTGAAVTLALGMTFQQMAAWGKDAYHHFAGGGSRDDTLIEHVWRKAHEGNAEAAPQINTPDHTNLIQQGDHYALMDDQGHEIAGNLHVNPDGTFDQATLDQLHAHGFEVNDDPAKMTHEIRTVKADDYWADKLSEHKREDWHHKGYQFSKFHGRVIEFPGKEQELYLNRDAKGVYMDINLVKQNMLDNIHDKLKPFGRAPDSSLDPQLKDLRTQLAFWNQSTGELSKHFQGVIIPTDAANHAGLSELIEGADSNGHIYFSAEESAMFTDDKMLHDGKLPFRYLELRLNGHTFATAQGHAPETYTLAFDKHHPEIVPIGHSLPPGVVHDYDVPPLFPGRGRKPLTPTEYGPVPASPMPVPGEGDMRLRSGYFGGQYFFENSRNRERWRQERSPRLLNNPEARLSQKEELDWYFEQQRSKRGANYIQELDGFIDQDNVLKNLSPETSIIVTMPVAAAHEMDNIYNTLQLYATQDKPSLDKTVILLNLNWADDANPQAVERTLAEVERAKIDFPNLQIASFTKVWPREWITEREGKIYGEVVKYLNDAALRSLQKAQLGHDAFLLTNDADCRGMSKNYLKTLLGAAGKNPEKDAFMGKLEWGSELYNDFPGFHVTMRLMQYLDSMYRHGDAPTKNIASSGANFLVKAGTFAAVGGYDSEIGAGADTDLGYRIKAARLEHKKSFTNEEYPIKYENGAWIDTDSNRSLEYYQGGMSVIKTWDNFDEGGYAPRTDLSGNGVENLEQDSEIILKRIEYQVTALVREWVGFENKKLYERALNFLLPPQGGVPSWETGPEDDNGEPTIILTDSGKAWLKNSLAEFAATNKKDILYRKRGTRAPKARSTPVPENPAAPPGAQPEQMDLDFGSGEQSAPHQPETDLGDDEEIDEKTASGSEEAPPTESEEPEAEKISFTAQGLRERYKSIEFHDTPAIERLSVEEQAKVWENVYIFLQKLTPRRRGEISLIQIAPGPISFDAKERTWHLPLAIGGATESQIESLANSRNRRDTAVPVAERAPAPAAESENNEQARQQLLNENPTLRWTARASTLKGEPERLAIEKITEALKRKTTPLPPDIEIQLDTKSHVPKGKGSFNVDITQSADNILKTIRIGVRRAKRPEAPRSAYDQTIAEMATQTGTRIDTRGLGALLPEERNIAVANVAKLLSKFRSTTQELGTIAFWNGRPRLDVADNKDTLHMPILTEPMDNATEADLTESLTEQMRAWRDVQRVRTRTAAETVAGRGIPETERPAGPMVS
jgi:hypothetical protein